MKKKPSKPAKKAAPTRVKPAMPFEAKDFLTIREVSGSDLEQLFRLADKMKKAPEAFYTKLKGRSLAMLFQKPSMRTRVSLEVGMAELGGSAVYSAQHAKGRDASAKCAGTGFARPNGYTFSAADFGQRGYRGFYDHNSV